MNDSPERTELPGIIELLKSRWPEAVLVIAFHACLFMLGSHIFGMSASFDGTKESAPFALLPEGWAFLIGFGVIVFLIISEMLRLGFLRTVLTGGCSQREPIELLKTGRYFFWRMIRFRIIYELAVFAVWFVLLAVFSSFLSGGSEPDKLPPWMTRGGLFLACSILMKPWLLIPAIIITVNCKVRESFQSLKQYRLMGNNSIIALFMVWIIVQVFFVMRLEVGSSDGSTGVQYFTMGIWAIVLSTLNLAITLAAVLLVANALKEKNELGELEIDE